MAYCKEPLANELFDAHGWWSPRALPNPYNGNLEMLPLQGSPDAVKPRACLKILWGRLSSLLFTALRKNVGNPAFSKHCLSLVDQDFVWDEGSSVPPVLANRNLSKFQVCCAIKTFRYKEAPTDLVPFLEYLSFWCKLFVKKVFHFEHTISLWYCKMESICKA